MSDPDKHTCLPLGLLEELMPMHAVVSSTGHILRCGSTLQKLRPDKSFVGYRFLEVFELRRPRGVTQMAKLCVSGSQRLNLRLRDHADMPMKGVALCLPDGQGFLINLSFGISVIEAVGRFDLNGTDFSPTDLTIEMLLEAILRGNNVLLFFFGFAQFITQLLQAFSRCSVGMAASALLLCLHCLTF